jgi:hypothetical protein
MRSATRDEGFARPGGPAFAQAQTDEAGH